MQRVHQDLRTETAGSVSSVSVISDDGMSGMDMEYDSDDEEMANIPAVGRRSMAADWVNNGGYFNRVRPKFCAVSMISYDFLRSILGTCI